MNTHQTQMQIEADISTEIQTQRKALTHRERTHKGKSIPKNIWQREVQDKAESELQSLYDQEVKIS